MGIDNPQLRTGYIDLLAITLGIQRVTLQLRVFTLERALEFAGQWLGGGQGMAGAACIAAQANLDLPGQIDQSLAILDAGSRGADQQLPACLLGIDADIRAALAVADHLAVVAAPLWHPELQLVHAGGQDHWAQHHQQDQDQLQTPAASGFATFRHVQWTRYAAHGGSPFVMPAEVEVKQHQRRGQGEPLHGVARCFSGPKVTTGQSSR